MSFKSYLNESTVDKVNLDDFSNGIAAVKTFINAYSDYLKSVRAGKAPVLHKKNFVKAGKAIGEMLDNIDNALYYSLNDPDSLQAFIADVKREMNEILRNVI